MPTHHHPVRHPVSLDRIAERLARENAKLPTYDAAGRVESHDSLRRRAAFAATASDPRNSVEPTPEVIQQRVRHTATVPSVLTIACDEHGAAVGEHCYRAARGVCAERIKARAALR